MTSLTDRYLAATLRTVPAPRRAEIADELRASIADMIEGRTAAGQDTAAAEREVLTELGHPDRLAAGYADRPLQLIGPTYYLVWASLLRRLLTVIPALVAVAVGVLKATLEEQPDEAIGAGIGAGVQAAVQITFWVTVAFAVLERTRTPLDLPAWSVDQLPEAPAERDVTLSDTCASIAFLLIILAYLPWQHYRSWVTDADGANLPILDPALWTSWLPALAAVLVASIVVEIVKYRTGRWTWPLVGVNAVLDLAFALPLGYLLLTDRLLNPALVDRFEWLREDGNTEMLTNVSVVVVAAVTIWSIAESLVKARRHRR
ncbi:permease prefix domain 1-containing protein [Micromonospora sp. KC723]|uniref:permease prefix domain 1-containing protein n=1 Tax=Micromonospora sp. KC723 TaxID=2530381 RepID=UPI001043103C|nr:permease prefix domain 1-containing protein [Micromonospora sp. KC723]TDB77696.1 hypothetical protein E1165_03080 [Micromonospora sp. KC723]